VVKTRENPRFQGAFYKHCVHHRDKLNFTPTAKRLEL
jgi:hypothetical protein